MVVKTYENGDKYDGDWVDEKKHGQGTLTYVDGGKYVGAWENNMRNGEGVNIWKNGDEYEGGWKNSKKHGQGRFTYANGGEYVGDWANDMKNGHGVSTWPNGDRYEGNWKNNTKHGSGIMYYADGGSYKGEWTGNLRHGQGLNKWSNGEKYDGTWKENKKHGHGTFYDADGSKHDGEWAFDKRAAAKKAPKSTNCSYLLLAREFVKSLNWPQHLYDTSCDRCYCTDCYQANWKDVIDAGDGKYVIPRGWVRIGLRVDPVFSAAHEIWEKWIVTFHGTTKIAAQSILMHRQFCLPGDKLIDGTMLGIRDGHIPDQKFIFTSPTIAYSSSTVYSPIYPFHSSHDNKNYQTQLVLQCRQMPKSFQVQRETLGLGHKQICKFISNETVEYFTDRRASLVAYGLLVRVREKIG
jgi:hypothetical protein